MKCAFFKYSGLINQTALAILGVFIIFNSYKFASADGLPGEYLLSDQWRLCLRKYSPITNPSLLTEQNYLSVYGVLSTAPDETSKLWENGLVIPVGLYRSIGVTAAGENGRDIQNVSESFLTDPYASQEPAVNNNNYVIILSYASNPFGKFNYGINLKAMYQGNFGDPEYGGAIDLALSYRLFNHPFFGYHTFGLTAHNIFSQSLDDNNEMSQPLCGTILYNADFFNHAFDLEVKSDISDFLADKDLFTNDRKYEWDFSLQGSIKVLPILRLSGNLESDKFKKTKYWGFATQFTLPQFNNGRDLSFIYHLRNSTDKNLRPSHSIYYRAEIGLHREEIFARKIARNASFIENNLYNKAMKLFFKGEYWDAYLIFKQLVNMYPDFYKNDNASYYSALCLENMDFRNAALRVFDETKQKYAKSCVIPGADLGIMRVHYRNGDFVQAQNQMIQLDKANVPDSIRMHGFYIMGQIECIKEDYRKAVQYLSIISETHPDYCFAQYSAAVARLYNNDDFNSVINHLENCISVTSVSKEQDEIKNKAFVAIGYIYYEEKALSKAVIALRLVPQTSIYYDDALLGLGWTAIKARQWKDCIDAGLLLSNNSKRKIMQCEGMLIQSYGYIMQKKYQNANDILIEASKICNTYNGTSPDTVFNRKFMYDNTRLIYNRIAEEIAPDNVLPDPENKTLDSLHKKQIQTKIEIDSYLRFAIEHSRLQLFERTLQKVKEDLDFTLSKTQRLMLIVKDLKTSDKIIEKTKEINALKEQMIKLDTNKK